jgi:5,10-methylene-tetrahydrofolate dehydrogenase/methenyl tetrahydrofolate cyclohydrolase
MLRSLVKAARPLAVRPHFARTFAAQKIDGNAISQAVRSEVAADVDALKSKHGDAGTPGLAVVLVGARKDSETYVNMKEKASEECGFKSVKEMLSEDVSEDELFGLVQKLNADPTIDGILVQLPLPDHINQKKILEAISVDKDVDGFHPYNMGGLARLGEELRQRRDGTEFSYRVAANNACTPLGCIELLDRSGVDLNGANVAVLGRSNIVGLPVAMMLLHRNATVTMCHSRTKDLPDVVRAADVVVAAIGIPEFVKGDWIKPGATVIDVGVNFKDAESKKTPGKMIKKMCGDVDYAAASEHCSQITPVPGGVGPMTIAMLMRNTVENAKRRLGEA